ncbi:MAG TPA: hypothetical protein VKH42_07680, partial [Vicinamibacterales bacterium]|nr:hypothetical protein [Vicinamibacterales bacterium]
LKGLLENRPREENALKTCATCPALIAEFLAETQRGQALARTALQANASDETALFFLGKLDLNYVWLQLGPLQRKTGWNEYWEARRSLDTVLKHSRATFARASPGPGSRISSTRGCHGARAGCSAGATGSRRSWT